MGGPSIPVGIPSFIFPLDAPEAYSSGGLADILKVSAGCFRCEIGSHRAWVCVKPFLHVDLELVFGMLVLENVGHFSGAPMVRSSCSVDLLRRASWDSERVPE